MAYPGWNMAGDVIFVRDTMTECILNGYQIIILPRQNGAYEVVFTPPSGTTQRYTRHGLKHRRGQLQRELEAIDRAEEILIAARKDAQQ
jgi:hypothetical protein